MKRSRVRSSSLLASFVLVFILSLFRYCLSSLSSFPSSFFFSSSFSWSLSFYVSFSVRDWISSMNSKHCLRIDHLIRHNRLHLHAFELRELSQCWVFERLFFCSNSFHFHHFCINMMLHFHLHRFRINMMLHIHVFRRSSSIFRSQETIAWSYHLELLNSKKRINDVYLMIFFKFTKSVRNSLIRTNLIFNENEHSQSADCLSHIVVSEFCESMTILWWWWKRECKMK